MASKSYVDVDMVRRATEMLIEAIGCDGEPGMQDTPNRVARLWKEFIEYNPGTISTTFESSTDSQIVLVSGMRVWSMCEHHLLPFWTDVAIAYIPEGKIIGLSKLARIAHAKAHRPQVQERLVSQIAQEVTDQTGSPHVAVIAAGEHSCMVMRGIKTPGVMTSSVMKGDFLTDSMTRQELFALLNLQKR